MLACIFVLNTKLFLKSKNNKHSLPASFQVQDITYTASTNFFHEIHSIDSVI